MRPAGVALVYAATRKNAEKYAAAIGEAGMRVRVYHAGLDDDDRTRAQDEFMDGRLDAIVATNAFGMGVDKEDVRVVIHADAPRSPEAYWQEAGRGGRDGQPAECVLLWNHADVRLQEFLIDAAYPPAELVRGLWKELRRRPRSARALERIAAEMPGKPHQSQVDSALRLLERHGWVRQGLTDLEAVDAPRGAPPLDLAALAARADVERRKLRAMIDYAYGADRRQCRRRYLLRYFGDQEWGDQASCGRCDVCDGTSGDVRPITKAGRGSRPKGAGTRGRSAAPVLPDDVEVDPDLVERLRALRTRLAREKQVPPYVIFNDRTLVALAGMRPRTEDQLLTVPGIGPAKVGTYGEAILDAMR
jgi:ATP-dependent DNA helicase RecQ